MPGLDLLQTSWIGRAADAFSMPSGALFFSRAFIDFAFGKSTTKSLQDH
jgi:hypothetical protein